MRLKTLLDFTAQRNAYEEFWTGEDRPLNVATSLCYRMPFPSFNSCLPTCPCTADASSTDQRPRQQAKMELDGQRAFTVDFIRASEIPNLRNLLAQGKVPPSTRLGTSTTVCSYGANMGSWVPPLPPSKPQSRPLAFDLVLGVPAHCRPAFLVKRTWKDADLSK